MAARTRSRSDDSTAVTVATRAPVAGTIYGTAPFTVYPATGSAVAGLQLSRLSGTDLADLIGVSEGLFVDAVAPGTLGYRSGLRRHDVLLTANDSVLTAVLVLQRIVNRSRDREVKLEILRGRERRTLWLRW
jgi:S1-C subfamily serine protease